jgi:hypothetical protein
MYCYWYMNVLPLQKTIQRSHLDKGILPMQDRFLLDIMQQVSFKIFISVVLYLAKYSTELFYMCLWKLCKENTLYSFAVCCLSIQSCVSLQWNIENRTFILAVCIAVFGSRTLHTFLYLELNSPFFHVYSFWVSTAPKEPKEYVDPWVSEDTMCTMWFFFFALLTLYILINCHLYTGLYT